MPADSVRVYGRDFMRTEQAGQGVAYRLVVPDADAKLYTVAPKGGKPVVIECPPPANDARAKTIWMRIHRLAFAEADVTPA